MTVAVFLLSLLGAMALGMPLAFSLLVCGVALMLHLDNFDTQIVSQNLINGADNFPLMAVPFFMLAGELMNAGGMSRRIVNSAMVWVGHFQGGLGYVAVFAALIMASLSGSAVADTAALAAAHVSISPAQALDAARVASDIVLLGRDLSAIADATRIAQQATKRMVENFQISAAYNVNAVPLALMGGATPLAAALAMSLSSITVSLNALRLR